MDFCQYYDQCMLDLLVIVSNRLGIGKNCRVADTSDRADARAHKPNEPDEDLKMAKYLFVYHGGSHPETEAETAEVMNAWGQWFGSMGDKVVDGGNPVGMSSTVQSDGSVAANGGANPASGYSLVEAASLDDALATAGGCPILAAGGSVEVAEAIDM